MFSFKHRHWSQQWEERCEGVQPPSGLVFIIQILLRDSWRPHRISISETTQVRKQEMKCWLTAHLLMRHAAPTLALNESVDVWLQIMLRTILKHLLLLALRLFIFKKTFSLMKFQTTVKWYFSCLFYSVHPESLKLWCLTFCCSVNIQTFPILFAVCLTSTGAVRREKMKGLESSGALRRNAAAWQLSLCCSSSAWCCQW